jgi:tripartite-type tricarboxylate transporter receptor subunit TctC
MRYQDRRLGGAFVAAALIAGPLLLAFAPACRAQAYPAKSLRIVLPFPAGGSADIIARLIGRKFGDSMTQTVVVDNRAGAAGIIGCELVARAPADGYTLLLGTTGTHTTNPAVFAKMPYDPVKDYAPVSLAAEAPFVLLVHPSLPARSIRELIAFARARPGQLNYASAGVGSSSHLGFELFNSMAGIKAVHVPYKGLGPAAADTIGGIITMTWDAIPSSKPMIERGRLRALGIGSLKRSPLLPAVPTIDEAGLPGFELGSWYGLFAPAGTPVDIVRQLHRETVKAVGAADVRAQFAAMGVEAVGSTPEEFAAVVQRDLAKWAKVARDVHLEKQ